MKYLLIINGEAMEIKIEIQKVYLSDEIKKELQNGLYLIK